MGRTQSTIRRLLLSDLSKALQLSTLAGWNQTIDDWRLLLELAPESCFCVESDGRIVATATLVCYGQRLAWVGMVLTHPDYRRRGLARNLLRQTVEYADKLGLRTLKLDATDEGRPLYEQFGFLPEQKIERWTRSRGEQPARDVEKTAQVEADSSADETAFGSDRSRLLRALRDHGDCFSIGRSLLYVRAGLNTTHLGPCVATEKGIASELVGRAMSPSQKKSWNWDLLPSNAHAVELARELGFVPARRLLRMYRGEKLRGEESLIYATAGFEFG